MDVPNFRNKEERDAWRNDNKSTNPKISFGEDRLPNCPEGSFQYPPEVYERIRKLFEEGKNDA